jgi:hypothetical protein
MLRLTAWGQFAATAKLSSHEPSRPPVPLFETGRNDLLNMLLSEPRLLGRSFLGAKSVGFSKKARANGVEYGKRNDTL